MANIKFSELSQLTVPATADSLAIVDASESGSEKSKYITIDDFMKWSAEYGYFPRAKFTYKDGDEIYISGARYWHMGTANQIVYWDSQLTYTFSSLSGNQWQYLYIDDSAVVTLGTNLLTSSEFVNSTTAPTYDHDKKGWYNGNDMCIGAFRIVSGALKVFYHQDKFIQYADPVIDRALADLDATWTAVVLTIPAISQLAQVTFYFYHAGSGRHIIGYWRTTGSSASTGHFAWRNYYQYSANANSLKVFANTSQSIDIKHSDATGTQEVQVETNGYYFPYGM